MAKFEELMRLMKAMESSEIAMVLLLVGVILMLLIFSAIKRGDNKNSPQGRESQRTAPTFESLSPLPDEKPNQDQWVGSKLKSSPDTQVKAEINPSGSLEPEVKVQAVVSNLQSSEVPQDSILRRHYDASHKVMAVSKVSPVVKESLADDSYSSIKSTIKQTQTTATTIVQSFVNGTVSMPEDSVLKRHFIQQIKTEIQHEMSPRPNDSVLKRHYDSHMRYELEKRLAS